jgi:MFS family permease
MGASFAVFYSFFGIPLGRLADTRSRRLLISVGVGVWSVMTAGSGLTRTFWQLALMRMGVGVGEASLSPAAYSLIADYFPRESLGVAISVYYMGVYLGTSVSLLLTGQIIDMIGHTPTIVVPILGAMASWRITFLVVGLPGALFALLAYTFKEPARLGLIKAGAIKASGGEAADLSFGLALAEMKRRWKPLLGISIGAIFQAVPTYALISWTPTFLQRVHGWTPGHSGRVLAGLLLSFGCLGMFTGGRLSDHFQKSGAREGPLQVGVICAIGTAIFLPAAFLMKQSEPALFLMGPGIFFLSLAMGTSPAALQPIFPNQVRGQVSALFLFCLSLGGLSLGPLMPGFLNDHLFHDGQMIGSSLAITIGAAAVLMLIAFRSTYSAYRTQYELSSN